MNKTEYEKMEEMANRMQQESLVKMGKRIKEAQDYHEGYNQGIEDLLKYARREMQSEKN